MLRDTANKSRYDVGLQVSFQRVTLESSLYYAATYLKLSFLDPSVWALG
ncbi:hypothetical protein [Wolbachia pipientis]